MIQIAEPEELLQKGYVFSENYKYAVKNMEDRRNGIFRTSNGELIGTKTSGRAVLNERTIPKDTDKVRLMNYFNGGSNIEVLNFWNYILAVSAGECRGNEFDGEARKAINMAIKTYTWHFLIVPKNDAMGYDITTKMQAYAPSYISENKKVTEDMEAVHNVWMESYRGAIFEANYIAGSKNSAGKSKSGRLLQNGCEYMIRTGKCATCYECLHYYYDNSKASNGGPVRFFDSNKNELSY